MEISLKNQIIKFFKYRFNLDEDKANEDEVINNIRKGIEFKGSSLWALIFAIFIASIGLNVNSTAVIIGAMLISPLMGPIMGIGLGAGILDIELVKKAAKNLIIASLISLVVSYLYFSISPIRVAQSELLARTSPTIWDVLIAFFGGLAGIVANSRKNFSNVIPGVAIATALMPPLCTAGYGLGTGHWSYFVGAFYLFIINCVFISIATFIMVRFLKFHTVSYTNEILGRKIQKWVGFIALLTIIPSIYMAYSFVQKEFFAQKIQSFITNELQTKNVLVVDKQIEATDQKAVLYVLGAHLDDSAIHKMIERKDVYGLKNAFIEIINSTGNKQANVNIEELKTGLIENVLKKQEEELKIKSQELEELKQQEKNANNETQDQKKVIEEFETLFGKQDEISLTKTLLYNQKDKSDTIAILYIKPTKNERHMDIAKIKKWLKVRLNGAEPKVCFER